MQRGGVASAGFRIGAPECQVHGSRHLLVEKNRSRRSIDALVGADAELSEKACAWIGVQDLLEVGIAARRARCHDFAVAEFKFDVRHVDASRAGWNLELDRATGRVLEWTGEDLATWHVASAVGVDPIAPVDSQS